MQDTPEHVEFHHVAYVVLDLDRAISQWRQLLGAEIELPPTRVTAHDVRVSFLTAGPGRIELVQRTGLNTAAGSPPRDLEHPDHLCFLCDDLDARVDRARSEGSIVVRPPVASEAFGGKRMCFVYYRHIGLIEWVQR